jgi:calcineurin-like phosphoesterase family protein
MKRRNFISKTLLASAAISLPIKIYSFNLKRNPIYFGLIADVHKDIMHDADWRLQCFIDESSQKKLDFIMQMGDFCVPHLRNNEFLNIWNQYPGHKYHVLGNHDTDGGYTREQTRKFWNMSANYYSFDKGGIHFIVLDGNDANPKPWSGYHRYIGAEQQLWLVNDLEKTKKPTIVFSHQTVELESGGIANLKEIRKILEDANAAAGFQKVLCCFSGHHHTDFMTQISGIYYVQINSASYRWVGKDFLKVRYSEEIDKKYPWIKYTYPYKEPLYTFVEIKHNKIIISSKETEFVGPGPKEMKGPITVINDPIVSKISGFKLKL